MKNECLNKKIFGKLKASKSLSMYGHIIIIMTVRMIQLGMPEMP